MLVTLFLLTYRYIGLMMTELSVMTTAYSLRVPGQKGIHVSAWGSFIGQLLLRSMDRADEIYESMQQRGFDGNFYYVDVKVFSVSGLIFTDVCITLFVLARKINVLVLMGSLFV